MTKKIAFVLVLLSCVSLPYCSGMNAFPISGKVIDGRTLLPIEGAEVLIEVRTPLFSLHGERSQPFFALQTVTGKDGTYHIPLTLQNIVDYRMTFSRVYKVTATKEGYALGGGWTLRHYTGVTYRDSPFENWLEHNPKLESELQFEDARNALREALRFPPMSHPIGKRPNNMDSLIIENRMKENVDEILRSLNFVGYMMERYDGASPEDHERLSRHCHNISQRFERSDLDEKQGVIEFLDGNYEGRDVSSLAARLTKPAAACLIDLE
jgi:hypothetical protein